MNHSLLSGKTSNVCPPRVCPLCKALHGTLTCQREYTESAFCSFPGKTHVARRRREAASHWWLTILNKSFTSKHMNTTFFKDFEMAHLCAIHYIHFNRPVPSPPIPSPPLAQLFQVCNHTSPNVNYLLITRDHFSLQTVHHSNSWQETNFKWTLFSDIFCYDAPFVGKSYRVEKVVQNFAMDRICAISLPA